MPRSLQSQRLLPLIALAVAGCGGTQATQTNSFGSMPLSNDALGSGAVKGNAAKKQPDLGANAALNGLQGYADDSRWAVTVDHAPVAEDSEKILKEIGPEKTLWAAFGKDKDGKPFGIPYIVVSGDAARTPIAFETKDSDAGPYPIPLDATPSADGGRLAVIDRDAQKVYEVRGLAKDGTTLKAEAGAVTSLLGAPRKAPSPVDAAGLGFFPGLVRYDESFGAKEIKHALRFTLARLGKEAKDDAPMAGVRLRLKKKIDSAKMPLTVQPIVRALQKYGMVLDDAGPDFALSGAPDGRWKEEDLDALKAIKASDFEVVKAPEPKVAKGKAPAKTAATAAPATASTPAAAGPTDAKATEPVTGPDVAKSTSP